MPDRIIGRGARPGEVPIRQVERGTIEPHAPGEAFLLVFTDTQ